LIFIGPCAAPRSFTVVFTVNPSGISIGAGLRAIRPKVTFRHLSRSIDPETRRLRAGARSNRTILAERFTGGQL
jgi:hypothetical protein